MFEKNQYFTRSIEQKCNPPSFSGPTMVFLLARPHHHHFLTLPKSHAEIHGCGEAEITYPADQWQQQQEIQQIAGAGAAAAVAVAVAAAVVNNATTCSPE